MKNLWRTAIVISVTLLVVATPLVSAIPALAASPQFPPGNRPLPGTTVVYNLYATDGTWTMADGVQLYSFGYIGGRQGQPFTYLLPDGTPVTVPTGPPAPAAGPITPAEAPLAGNAQFPAPVIYATTNDIVQINLKNLGITSPTAAADDPHSIHLHGLDVDVANDGVPETSVAAVSANAGTPGAGNVVTYMFRPTRPGTYMWHCHQEADIHVTMGMYGALVVYNPVDPAAVTGPGTGRGGILYGQRYDKDFIMLLSDTDVNVHDSEGGTVVPTPDNQFIDFTGNAGGYNLVKYEPQYWFINGLSFPQTVHAGFPTVNGWANWIAAHPGYDPLITGSVARRDMVLVRVINMGFETQPMHMHGYHGAVIGSDQRPFSWTNGQYQKNTLTIGSGETYEWLINIADQRPTSTYPAQSQTKYDPVTGLPAVNTSAFPPIDGGAGPYIGGPVVTGSALGPSPSQIFVFHNHDDYKATNNGVYPGGMFTIIVPAP